MTPHTKIWWHGDRIAQRATFDPVPHAVSHEAMEVQMTQDTRPDGPAEAVGESGLVRMQETGPPTEHPGGYRSPPALSTVEAVAEALIHANDEGGYFGGESDSCGLYLQMHAGGVASRFYLHDFLTALRARGYDVVEKG